MNLMFLADDAVVLDTYSKFSKATPIPCRLVDQFGLTLNSFGDDPKPVDPFGFDDSGSLIRSCLDSVAAADDPECPEVDSSITAIMLGSLMLAVAESTGKVFDGVIAAVMLKDGDQLSGIFASLVLPIDIKELKSRTRTVKLTLKRFTPMINSLESLCIDGINDALVSVQNTECRRPMPSEIWRLYTGEKFVVKEHMSNGNIAGFILDERADGSIAKAMPAAKPETFFHVRLMNQRAIKSEDLLAWGV